MNKFLAGSLILLVNFGYANQVYADFQSDIFDCFNKQNSTDRLDCYDTVTKDHKTRHNVSVTTSAKTDLSKNSPKTKMTKAEIPAVALPTKPSTAQVKTETQPELISTLDAFGQTESLGPDSIKSRIVGEFKGWKKGMKLTLENGQIWKVTSNRSGYKRMTNPVITISRSMFGSFNANVEGMNAGAKVKRTK